MEKIKQIELRKGMQTFEKSEQNKSIKQLITTLVPFFGLWIIAFYCLRMHYLLSLLLCVIAAGFLIRTFIIFHDCCHYSFFKKRKANEVVGTLLGILTLFPYTQWQHSHAIHHATSGNLDKRGVGDMWVLTVNEYNQANKLEKVKYRLYRNPFIMFVVGPIYVFLIQQRFNKKGAKKKERVNTYMTNLSIFLIVAMLVVTIGWKAFLLIQVPIFLISGVAGVWLFYVQHQFEDSYFEWSDEWEYVKAAVEGSSFYKLPKILQWITGNIGYHHVHRLSPRVPNYNLERAHNETIPLKHVPTVTLKTSLKSLSFRSWDEEKKKFVSFKEAKRSLK